LKNASAFLLTFLLLISNATPQSGQMRGKSSMRGSAVFGMSGCAPLVMACQGTQITVTSAEINGDTAVILVPAQGPNTFIQLISLTVQYIPGSTPFRSDYQPVGSLFNVWTCGSLIVRTSMTTPGIWGGTCANNGNSGATNTALDMVNNFGAIPTGNGSLIVTPVYTVIATQ